jgi:hypothetical protein
MRPSDEAAFAADLGDGFGFVAGDEISPGSKNRISSQHRTHLARNPKTSVHVSTALRCHQHSTGKDSRLKLSDD